MDRTLDPGSRIRRLPKPLRYPALLLRNAGVRPRPRWTYNADGLATLHHSPFHEDPEWTRLYEEAAEHWSPGGQLEIRWRLWVLTTLGRQCQHLDGSFAEFGVYRGGCAFMLLATTSPERLRKIFLFDTFEGMPTEHLTAEESQWGLEGHYADTSVELVGSFLSRFADRFEICPGDVFETLERAETGPLALAHVDLNSGDATRRVLEYVYPRMVGGGAMVFDDYGATGGGPQREVIHEFFDNRPEAVLALPTGQATVTKL